MNSVTSLRKQLESGALHSVYPQLYGSKFDTKAIDKRYDNLIEKHQELFNDYETAVGPLHLFSTAGRSELAGNHTDHNLGKVIAATINLDTIGAVRRTNDNMVVLISEGFPAVKVDITSLAVRKEEQNTTGALLRGIAAAFVKRGLKVGGWIANTTTNVLKGSGLSSSAAIEVLCATIFNNLYNDDVLSPVDLAIIGQYAENVYFGKPSGLMDQVACAQGGIVGIDFKNPDSPILAPIDFAFTNHGYSLVIVDTKGNHADLTPDYAAAPMEMKAVAGFFGKSVLREVSFEEFEQALPILRKTLQNDRALLRTYHFLTENERVTKMLEALQKSDIEEYLRLVKESGDSSYKFLQNLYSSKHPTEQGLPLAIAMTERFLDGEGACRVHGGGFAGTIQAYIPLDRIDSYCEKMDYIFGAGSATTISVRSRKTSRIL